LKRDVYKVIQFADIHMDFHYAEGSATECNMHMCCRKNYRGKGKASQWGEYTCNAPMRTVEMFLQKAAKINPDVLLYTGDSPPHHLWYEKLGEHMNSTRVLGKAMYRNLPGVPIYPAIGNHDAFPSNLYYVPDPDTKLLHDVLVETYSSLSEESVKNLHKGGYYLEHLTPKLRLLTYNTNYGYENNWFNILSHSEQDLKNMQDFVEEALKSARNDKAKVIFMGHHPVGTGIISFEEWVTRMCTEYHDVITLHTTGHKHTDLFRLFKSAPDAWASSVQFAAPSANPYSKINPSMRVYEIDRKTNELLDFVQYHMDFSNIGSGDEPEISEVYRASEEYGLSDLSARSWHEMAIRMLSDTDYLNKYEDNFGTGVASNLRDTRCKEGDQRCHNHRVCQVTSSTFKQRIECNLHGVQIPASESRCISSCEGREDGEYQSCNGCNVYVTCSNGRIYDNRPCPGSLVWDDVIKRCEFKSQTCSERSKRSIEEKQPAASCCFKF